MLHPLKDESLMKTALLVIDDDPQRGDELCLLLRFMEESHITRADSSNWRVHVEHNIELLSLIHI